MHSVTQIAPKPANETLRLQALQSYEILDTEPEQGFDDIVKIAAQICDTPIALVSLVDDERQWFKAKIGLDAIETDRDVAFCAHAILSPEEVLHVPDTELDVRFKDNPLVTGGPKISFYAGAPLLTQDGCALGTLCVIDQQPRDLSTKQLSALKALARQIVAQFELRRALAETQRSNNDLDGFASIAAHDLRAPLRGIDQLAGFIQEDCANILPPSSQDYLGKLRSRVKRLDGMLQGLLSYSRLGHGNTERELLNPRPLLEAVIDMVIPMDKFSVTLPEKMPHIFAADAKFNLVFRNLLANVVKHHDEERGQVVVTSEIDGDMVTIAVEDDGPGIPSEQQQRVFQLFTTLNARDDVESSGMGLALVKRAIESEGGSVFFENLAGRGTKIITTWMMGKA